MSDPLDLYVGRRVPTGHLFTFSVSKSPTSFGLCGAKGTVVSTWRSVECVVLRLGLKIRPFSGRLKSKRGRNRTLRRPHLYLRRRGEKIHRKEEFEVTLGLVESLRYGVPSVTTLMGFPTVVNHRYVNCWVPDSTKYHRESNQEPLDPKIYRLCTSVKTR